MIKILLVDDEKDIREVLETLLIDFLGEENTILDTANNGLEALELVNKNEYDFIFSDDQMPHKKGIQLAIETMEMKPNQKFYLVTGADTEILKRQYPDLKIEYLSKPFDLKQILKIIEKS